MRVFGVTIKSKFTQNHNVNAIKQFVNDMQEDEISRQMGINKETKSLNPNFAIEVGCHLIGGGAWG